MRLGFGFEIGFCSKIQRWR